MRDSTDASTLARGELARLAYRLGRTRATGVLTIHPPGAKPEPFVLRQGQLMTAPRQRPGRNAAARLARMASFHGARWELDGGTCAYPPGATGEPLHLSRWAREHLERQVDAALARHLARELAGMRLALRADAAPDASMCDETDLRILAAMDQPRRLDQIAPLARAPRFRLIAFLHFLRQVGALDLVGVAAPAPGRAGAAHRLLGIDAGADPITVKRAYRRLARALHPDLHPEAGAARRRLLERKLAEVTAAYRVLSTGT